MADTGTYLYAVARTAPETQWHGMAGVAGSPVRTLAHAELVAYVSTVSLEEFGEEPPRRKMEDLAWLEAMARAHHGVVEAIARQAPTAPVRLFTVYHRDEHVRELLDRRHADFTAVLATVAGRTEWGVKAYVDPDALLRHEQGTAGAGEQDAPRPGTAYLQRRRASMRDRDALRQEAASRADRVHAELAAIAAASRRHRPQDPRLSGREGWMVLNGAYLVDNDRSEVFAAAVDALQGEGVEVELTGPWAPYSITTLDLSTPSVGAP